MAGVTPFASCLAQCFNPACIDLRVLGFACVDEEWRIRIAAVASSDVRATARRPRAAAIQRTVDVGGRSCSAFVVGIIERMMRFVHVVGPNSHIRQEGVREYSAVRQGGRILDGEAVLAQCGLKQKET